jgi:hypothetical protein
VAQAKRSPVLGYNHNVKYRGVVFHVQTEDSGLQNPHLFTHLFHGGVIVSTRKLVYDAGSNEDAIKALMQAQHKAVMKDLMKGAFDEKIDQYLSDVEGLTARAAKKRASTEVSPPPDMASPLEIVDEALSEPIELPLKSRTTSDDRTRPVAILQPSSPPARADATSLGVADSEPEPAPVKARTSTAQKVSRPGIGAAATPAPIAVRAAAPVEIGRTDDASARSRMSRDTAVDRLDGVVRNSSDSMSPNTVPQHSIAEPPSGERAERPGEYSVSRKTGDLPLREKTGRIAAAPPVGLDKPGAGARSSLAGSDPRATEDSGSMRAPHDVSRQAPSGRAGTPVPTPSRAVTSPIASRPASHAIPAPGSGVVVTRPAVIVGAPRQAAQPARVRKAREDEGRGFGQGLISEKSLDEVILAYLSEDAEEK